MPRRVIIVGAGHNGLVCAAYLARAGMHVTVLEARHVLGGAAVTEEFYPGYRNSVCSYTVSLLHPGIIKDLQLHKHGLKLVQRRVNNFLPLASGDSFASIPGELATEVARFSDQDAERLVDYENRLAALVPVMREVMLMTPSALDGAGIGDLFSLFKLSKSFSGLNRQEKQFLLTLFSRSAGEILDDFFSTEALKALLGFDAIVGNFVSPYTPGNGYNLLHHLLGEVNGERGRWGHAIGGMGAVSDAITREGSRYGVRFITDSPVESIASDQGKAVGVVSRGEFHQADIVVANTNPVTLFTRLLDDSVVSDDLRTHFSQYKCGSGSFRMNVALEGLPEFSGRTVPGYREAGIIIGDTLAYQDQAWQSARDEGWSGKPVVEMLIPSLVDTTLAPSGCHVASLFCQQFSPDLGQAWEKNRDAAVETILSCVETYFPGFGSRIAGIQALSPWDLEQQFGLPRGDIFHGRLSLEQLFSARPALGHAGYAMPLKGLYLCGSGAHPGGGVSGIPGYNAARQILRRAV